NHKENVAAKISEIKKKSVAKAKQEQKMSKQFAAMEEAAQKAYEEDLKRLAGQSSDNAAPHGSHVSAGESVAPSEAPVKKQKKPKKQSASVPSESRLDVWLRGTTNNNGLLYYYTVTGGELMFETHACPAVSSLWETPDGFVDESSSRAHQKPRKEEPVQASFEHLWTLLTFVHVLLRSEKVDLQLPQVESVAQTAVDVPQEPRARFRERTITSLGAESSAGATFKKRKTENGKSRSLRQRETDE
uniref:Uncharacterized protein n=1 Tax=Cyprinus carpio TaxID=7962 RepID=A0A8C1NHE0_CYPCA